MNRCIRMRSLLLYYPAPPWHKSNSQCFCVWLNLSYWPWQRGALLSSSQWTQYTSPLERKSIYYSKLKKAVVQLRVMITDHWCWLWFLRNALNMCWCLWSRGQCTGSITEYAINIYSTIALGRFSGLHKPFICWTSLCLYYNMLQPPLLIFNCNRCVSILKWLNGTFPFWPIKCSSMSGSGTLLRNQVSEHRWPAVLCQLSHVFSNFIQERCTTATQEPHFK